MKILFIIVCLMSTKSAFGVNNCMPYQRLNNFRRRLFFPSQCRTVNFEMIAPKQFFECNYHKSTFNQNRDYPKHQKLSDAVSGLRNNASHIIIRNPITGKTKYFMNPKIIMVPSLTQAKEIFGNDQNQKQENREKIPSSYARPLPKNEKQTLNSGKEESLRKNQNEDFHPDFVDAKEFAAENPKLENKTTVTEIPRISLYQSPSNPSNETYHQPASNLISLLRVNPTQTYEVEEIFEDVINVDEELKKIAVNEKTFFDPEIKDISNDHHEQKVLNDSIRTIVQEITGTENILSSSEKTSTKVSADEKKANVHQTTATTQVQPSSEISLPEKTVLFNETSSKTTPAFKEYYSHGKNHSDRLHVNNEQGPPRPLNILHEIFKLPPPNTTYDVFENSKKHDSKKFESLPHTFFGFFNKKVTEKPTQKSAGVPKNLSLQSLLLSTNLFGNLSGGSLQNLNENPQPEPISTSTTSQTFTPSLQDRMTSNFFTHALNTKPPLPLNQNKAESESTTSKIPISHTASPIFNFIVRNLDLTTSHSQEFPDGSLSIGLLSTTISSELKKDQESNGKNSRKMHFNQNTQKETESSENTEKSNQQPRRSDILITDYMDDYKDSENRLSTLTFLGRIKPNGTILSDNFSSSTKIDYYISLIPDMLNDIRENKISPQDFSLLSSIFGKYWPKILALSNNTELDVLPLLTMKKEKDLISVLEAHFSNESETPTTEMVEMEVDGKESSETYDYTNEELFDVFNQEPGRKRKANRNKRDYEDKNLESDEYFETEGEERNERIQSKVDFIVYDESGEDENPSALELTNTADFYSNVNGKNSENFPGGKAGDFQYIKERDLLNSHPPPDNHQHIKAVKVDETHGEGDDKHSGVNLKKKTYSHQHEIIFLVPGFMILMTISLKTRK